MSAESIADTTVRERWQRYVMLALWMYGLVRPWLEAEWLAMTALGGLVVYLLLAAPMCSRLSRVVLLVTGGLAVAICAIEGQWHSLLDSLLFALIFTAFLPTLQLIRASLAVGPEVAQSRTAFARVEPKDLGSAFVVGGNVLGSVLTLGALAMLAPLQPVAADGDSRRAMAQSILRGLALAISWSPFTVAMALVLAFWPALQLWQVVASGLLVTALGIGLTVLLAGGGARSVWRALSGFRPLAVPLGGAMVAVIALAAVSPFGTIQTIVLAMPLGCLLWVVHKNPREYRRVARTTFGQLHLLGGEMMLFCGAIALGRVLQNSPTLNAMLNLPVVAELPTPAIIAFVMAAGFIMALAGLHSVVLGACQMVLLGPFSERIADIVAVQIVLYGWSCGALMSLTALSVVLASSLYRVPIQRVILGPNIWFMLLHGAVLFLALAAANESLS